MSRTLASIGVVQVLIILVGMLRSKVLAVLLGPGDVGVVGTVDQTVQSLAQLCALSLPFTAMKFMSRRHSESHERFEQTYATFFRALTVLSVVAVAAVAVLLAKKPDLFGDDLAAYRNYFLLALVGVPAVMLNIFFVNTLASAQRGAASAMLNMLVLLALTLAAIGGVLVDGLDGVYPAVVGIGVVTIGATIWYLRRSLGVRITAPTDGIVAELRESPQVVSYSVLVYSALSAYSLTMLATRYYVFGALGKVGAGHLQALLQIALAVSAVMATMTNLYFIPHINRMMPVSEKIATANEFARKIAALTVIAGVAFALFPGFVLRAFFSAEFSDAAGALYVFIAWQCLLQTVNVYFHLLIGLDDIAVYALIVCAGYGGSALAFPGLVSRYGLRGAALALAVAMVVGAVATSARLRLKFGGGVDRLTIARTLYCTLVISGAGVLFAASSELTLTGIALRAGYLLLVVAVLWLTFTADERALVAEGVTWGRQQGARLGFPVR
jgi:O-antigen/teichoic acid export membrane protein